MLSNVAFDAIDELSGRLRQISRKIWENPEGPYREHIASGLCADFLEQEGFRVERGCFGLPTALRAEWGSGHPVIGFLGEYDALPGQSQKDVSHKEPVEEGAYGHGCGHNLLADCGESGGRMENQHGRARLSVHDAGRPARPHLILSVIS